MSNTFYGPDFELLTQQDPAIAAVLLSELKRQQTNLQLIASENFTSRAVLAALGSTQAAEMLRCITDFYEEGPVSPAASKLRSQAESQSYYLAAIQSLYRKNVPGRRYLLKSLFRFYRRNSGYTPNRRSFVVMGLIFLNPLGRYLVKRSKSR